MYLNKSEVQSLLNKKDLTKIKNHAVSLIIDEIYIALEKNYNQSPIIEYGEKIVSINDNYYELGYKENEITLGVRYTKYIDDKTMLRTQMTSVIPSLLTSYKKDIDKDKLWMCPGVVYRRDVRDKTHVGEPHQMDIWYLTKSYKNREDLLNLVSIIVSVIEKHKKTKIKWRYNETSHNYTDDGIEVEIYHNNKWLEILECGLISKDLLKRNNLIGYSGLALGLGLERLIMIIKEIDDIRILYSDNSAISNQLTNLNKYKSVSNQPSIKRDLSIAVNKSLNEEELTELILSVVDESVEVLIESISILSQTKYENLPQIAKTRLGMVYGQENILLRIVLRDLEKTLTTEEANSIYTDIYNKIHKGSIGYTID